MNVKENHEPIPPLKRGRLNSYSPVDIKRWGVQRFLDAVCEKETIPIPDLGFSEEENRRMDEVLNEEREASRDDCPVFGYGTTHN